MCSSRDTPGVPERLPTRSPCAAPPPRSWALSRPPPSVRPHTAPHRAQRPSPGVALRGRRPAPPGPARPDLLGRHHLGCLCCLARPLHTVRAHPTPAPSFAGPENDSDRSLGLPTGGKGGREGTNCFPTSWPHAERWSRPPAGHRARMPPGPSGLRGDPPPGISRKSGGGGMLCRERQPGGVGVPLSSCPCADLLPSRLGGGQGPARVTRPLRPTPDWQELGAVRSWGLCSGSLSCRLGAVRGEGTAGETGTEGVEGRVQPANVAQRLSQTSALLGGHAHLSARALPAGRSSGALGVAEGAVTGHRVSARACPGHRPGARALAGVPSLTRDWVFCHAESCVLGRSHTEQTEKGPK